MISQVKKWGNSLSVRVPQKIANKLNLKEGSSIDIKASDNQIIITSTHSELDTLINKINEHNRHLPTFNDTSVGKEVW